MYRFHGRTYIFKVTKRIILPFTLALHNITWLNFSVSLMGVHTVKLIMCCYTSSIVCTAKVFLACSFTYSVPAVSLFLQLAVS